MEWLLRNPQPEQSSAPGWMRSHPPLFPHKTPHLSLSPILYHKLPILMQLGPTSPEIYRPAPPAASIIHQVPSPGLTRLPPPVFNKSHSGAPRNPFHQTKSPAAVTLEAVVPTPWSPVPQGSIRIGLNHEGFLALPALFLLK